MPEDDRGGQDRQPRPAERLPDEGDEDDDADEAVDDRGDARQELDQGLDDAPDALGGELRQDDGAGQAEGDADDEGPGRDVEGADDHRQEPEGLFRRVPVLPGQEALQAVLEHDGRALLDDEHGDDEEDRRRPRRATTRRARRTRRSFRSSRFLPRAFIVLRSVAPRPVT